MSPTPEIATATRQQDVQRPSGAGHCWDPRKSTGRRRFSTSSDSCVVV